LSQQGKRLEVSAGAVIVATGAERAETAKFLGGKASGVLTQVELEQKIHENKLPAGAKNVVMIQCAGSRDDERPYCSRICCSMAVKNALAIKKKSPDANVFVLYRDVRTYGFRELYYKQAREAGVVFIRYTREQEPVVSEAGGLRVSLTSPDFPEPLVIETDLVALSAGVEADRINNKRVSDMLKVPLNADGFYVEAHMKLRPVDFATEGVFLCGLAHSPKFMDESIAQARAAAGRAATILSKTYLDVSPQVSRVDQSKCISCMTCVHVCPYGAPYCNTDGKGQIEAAKCMGCGICVSECPARAIQLNHFETNQFRAVIEQLFADDNGTQTRAPVQAGVRK
jgi:heterodisulfide reductase subunit A